VTRWIIVALEGHQHAERAWHRIHAEDGLFWFIRNGNGALTKALWSNRPHEICEVEDKDLQK
jgi:hypothetical protein